MTALFAPYRDLIAAARPIGTPHLAADVARRHAARLRADGDRAPCVLIFQRIGESTHARAFADLSDDGTLTVVSVDDHAWQAIYRPGQWREALVYDADGDLLYTLDPPHDHHQ